MAKRLSAAALTAFLAIQAPLFAETFQVDGRLSHCGYTDASIYCVIHAGGLRFVASSADGNDAAGLEQLFELEGLVEQSGGFEQGFQAAGVELDQADGLGPTGVVGGKCFPDSVTAVDLTGQNPGVDQGAVGSLAEVGGHGVGGVTEQRCVLINKRFKRLSGE